MIPSGARLLPLRACLLSGGASRRMGRDKALLPHPEGGTWLERSLRLLADLELPISLLSRHPSHLELARGLQPAAGTRGSRSMAPITPIAEPPPWEGPLLALQRLMQRYPGERLLLAPVDMPWLDRASLQALVAAAAADPGAIWIAAAERPQPLLGIYPAVPERLDRLAAALAAGERSLQRWLAGERLQQLDLPPLALANINTPQELQASGPPRTSTGTRL